MKFYFESRTSDDDDYRKPFKTLQGALAHGETHLRAVGQRVYGTFATNVREGGDSLFAKRILRTWKVDGKIVGVVWV